MKKQHFQTILKAGTAILVCSMVLAGCGTKNQKNAIDRKSGGEYGIRTADAAGDIKR